MYCLFIKVLCDQVKLIPEDNKMIVFNNGKSHRLMISIPKGGQINPIHNDGDKVK